jgi:DnaJ-class molecular chaperone
LVCGKEVLAQELSQGCGRSVPTRQVLSDKEKRQVYDLYGEDGLKFGGPPPAEGAAAGAAGPGFRYSSRSAEDIFAEVRATGRLGDALGRAVMLNWRRELGGAGGPG